MAIEFDYDLQEPVRIGQRDISLRRAVLEYVEAKKNLPAGHVMLPPMWHRDQGKRPSAFEIEHIEALAQLPVFEKASDPQA
jgi:hypothetical protein